MGIFIDIIMNQITLNENNLAFYPDIYEGSCIPLFHKLDFNLSVFLNENIKKERGRRPFKSDSLLKALLVKTIKSNKVYRSIEAKLRMNPTLAESLGFDSNNTPSDSTLKQFFSKLKIRPLKKIMRALVSGLRLLNILKYEIVALDSTPIKAYFKPPTKENSKIKDPNAEWGYSKSKNGWYYGYKAHIIVDTETQIPIECIATPANISDQKMVRLFIWRLKKQGIFPKYTLLDKGYDSEYNHFDIREIFGSIGLIARNMRKKKKKIYKTAAKQGKKIVEKNYIRQIYIN
ncbi:MAG: transposase [Candidatus Helarchaeota archaeon]